MEKIVQTLSIFIKEHHLDQKPLLVGFSGGEDSMALVHALWLLRIPIHLAHFDHGWRSESGVQAAELAEWAEKQNLVFHKGCSTLGKCSELEARAERYQFFQKIYVSGQFAALVLAHHFDDQAETILKRVLEGANLTSLKAMPQTSFYENISVWRPFLSVTKKDIQEYLQYHHLEGIDDYTNRERQFLRARMRLELFPMLNESFGKETAPSLVRLGHYASELDAYLKKKTSVYTSAIIEGPFGTLLDFSPFFPLEFIEIRYVLRTFFEKNKITPSFAILEKILNLLHTKASNCKIKFENQELFIDRGKIFIIKSLPQFTEKKSLINEEYLSGKWQWKITRSEGKELIHQNWKDWWLGKVTISLAVADYELIPPNQSMSKIWTNNKVPQFLRSTLPLVVKEGKVVGDFLSGKRSEKTSQKNILVTIEVISRE